MNPANFPSAPLGGVNPLLYMNPMLLSNPQLAMNPVFPSLANQIAANQLLANQMMLRQFLMSGAGQMYPQPPMMPGSSPYMATDASLLGSSQMKTAMQQIVAKGRQPPPNVNLFKPGPNPNLNNPMAALSRKRKFSPPSNFPGKRPCLMGVAKPSIGRNEKQAEGKATKRQSKGNAKSYGQQKQASINQALTGELC